MSYEQKTPEYLTVTEWLLKEARTAKDKLYGHSGTQPEEHGHHVERTKEQAAHRTEWRQRVAQCIQQDAG